MESDRTDGQAPALPITSANESVFFRSFEPVRQLVLDEGASLVHRDGLDYKEDELWIGDAFDPLTPDAAAIPVYVRLGKAGALVAELVCGCLARAMQLPAPEVFLISIPAGHLPDSKLASTKGPTLCVGTRDIGGNSFTQLLHRNGNAAIPLLRQWPDLHKVVAFDEWLANPDRNTGNLIYVAQTLHIIDHAEAFGGSSRELFPLAELTDTSFTNLLADMFTTFPPESRSELLDKVQTWILESANSLNVQAVVTSALTSLWNTPEQDNELVNFIKARLTITHSLLCLRLGHPQLSLQAS